MKIAIDKKMVGDDRYNQLSIKADYQKGGVSFLSGEYSGRGVFAVVMAEKVENGVRSFVIGDNSSFKVMLYPCQRKSAGLIAKAEAAINALSQKEVKELYMAGQYKELAKLIQEVAGAGPSFYDSAAKIAKAVGA